MAIPRKPTKRQTKAPKSGRFSADATREPRRAKAGRPPFVPTNAQRHEVMAYRANGVRNEVIANRLGIHIETLTKHFATELANARDEMIAVGGGVVLRAMINGDWRAALEWLARWGGPEWAKSERRLMSQDPLGSPLQVTLSKMSNDELANALAEMEHRDALADQARALSTAPPKRPNGVGH